MEKLSLQVLTNFSQDAWACAEMLAANALHAIRVATVRFCLIMFFGICLIIVSDTLQSPIGANRGDAAMLLQLDNGRQRPALVVTRARRRIAGTSLKHDAVGSLLTAFARCFCSQSVLQALLDDRSPPSLDPLSLALMNVTREPGIAALLYRSGSTYMPLLVSLLTHERTQRRAAAAGAVRNMCFLAAAHSELVTSGVAASLVELLRNEQRMPRCARTPRMRLCCCRRRHRDVNISSLCCRCGGVLSLLDIVVLFAVLFLLCCCLCYDVLCCVLC